MALALTVVLAGALSLSAYAGVAVLVLAVALVQGFVASGWHRTLLVPGRVGALVIAGGAALGGDVLLVRHDQSGPLAPLSGVLGLTIVAGFVQQMVRRAPREGVTASISATTTLTVTVVLAALYLPAYGDTSGSAALVTTVVVAAAGATLLGALPGPTWVSMPLGLAAGGALGWLVGQATHLGAGNGGLLGLAAAVLAEVALALVRRAAGHDRLTAAALPIAFAGPAAYILGRILLG
jgi:hypothetical protein